MTPIGALVGDYLSKGSLPSRVLARSGPLRGVVFTYSEPDRAYVEPMRVVFLLAAYVRDHFEDEFVGAGPQQMELIAS